MLRIGFRTMANADIGLGHLKRCLALASTITDSQHFYLCETDDTAQNIIKQEGHAYSVVGLGNFSPKPDGLDVCIFDLTNPYSIKYQELVATEALNVQQAGGLAVLIDGLADIVIVSHSDFPIDILIKPYAGAETVKDAPFRQLCGASWAIFSKDIIERAERLKTSRAQHHSLSPRKVLVTCGASDPNNTTALTLKALAASKSGELNIRVIVGPFFTADLIAKIEHLSSGLKRIELIHAPDSLIEHMAWCDFAIATSGLTKYELALMGTPSIQMSLDHENAIANEGFAQTGCSLHLGPSENVTVEQLTDAIDKLESDQDLRETMTEKCIRTVDTQGNVRITEQLEELIRARSHI